MMTIKTAGFNYITKKNQYKLFYELWKKKSFWQLNIIGTSILLFLGLINGAQVGFTSHTFIITSMFIGMMDIVMVAIFYNIHWIKFVESNHDLRDLDSILVKIISSSHSNSWYNDKRGEHFVVKEFSDGQFICEEGYINATDVRIIYKKDV